MHTQYWPSVFCHTRNRQQAPRRKSAARIVLALLWPLLPTSVSAATATPASVAAAQTTIQISQGKTPGAQWQLNVKQALLADIIKEVAAKTKVDIHYSVLPEIPVTATCVADKVQQLLECLVGKQIGVVSQKPEGSPQEQVWLLGSSMGGCPAATAAAAEETVSNEPPPPLDKKQSNALLGRLKKAKTAAERAEALGHLAMGADIKDPKVRKELDDALADSDPNIRSQALTTVSQLDKDNAAEAIGRALNDDDRAVRMAAIDTAADNQDLLEQAVNDRDESVGSYAAAKLAQLKRNLARQGLQ
jgi:hypothetical protein